MNDILDSESGCTTANNRVVRKIPVLAGLVSELESSGLKGLQKDVVYWIISESFCNKSKCCAIHQGLLKLILGSADSRGKVISFLKTCKYLRAASDGFYLKGTSARRYETTYDLEFADKGTQVTTRNQISKQINKTNNPNQQQPINRTPTKRQPSYDSYHILNTRSSACEDSLCAQHEDESRGITALPVEYVQVRDHVTGLRVWMDSRDVCWRTVDFSGLMRRRSAAVVKIGWTESVESVENARMSLDRCDAGVSLSEDDIRENAVRSAVEKAARECKRKERVCTGEMLEKVQDDHLAIVKRFADRRSENVSRIDGRVYHSVTSLPKGIRSKLVLFNGQSEGFDISSCYPWLLGASFRLRQISKGKDTAEVDSLLDLIESGGFYAKLAELAGIAFESGDDKILLKQDFQQFCLFGPIGFHPLWLALKEICPGICRTISWWRRQYGGATRLAQHLQRLEGQLMTDGVVAELVRQGIPCVQVHDGAIVPVGFSELGMSFLRKLSFEIYGRQCRVVSA